MQRAEVGPAASPPAVQDPGPSVQAVLVEAGHLAGAAGAASPPAVEDPGPSVQAVLVPLVGADHLAGAAGAAFPSAVQDLGPSVRAALLPLVGADHLAGAAGAGSPPAVQDLGPSVRVALLPLVGADHLAGAAGAGSPPAVQDLGPSVRAALLPLVGADHLAGSMKLFVRLGKVTMISTKLLVANKHLNSCQLFLEMKASTVVLYPLMALSFPPPLTHSTVSCLCCLFTFMFLHCCLNSFTLHLQYHLRAVWVLRLTRRRTFMTKEMI